MDPVPAHLPEPPADDQRTEQLVRAARAGDRDAVEDLIAAHLPSLRAFVRVHTDRALRQRESCSDLVQTTCREALEQLDRFEWRGAGSFRAWLHRMALNKVIDHERYHRAERRDPAREQDDAGLLAGYATVSTPSRAAEAAEAVRAIEAAFDRLGPADREVIALARIAGLPHAEVASQLGKSEEAVRTMLKRALVRLAAELDR
jgi:RNA polymerase sigma-70 factor (ECF subfamily)